MQMMSSSVDDDNSYEGVDNEHCSELVSARLPNSNNIIKGQKDAYAIGKKIAPGKYGAVYEVLRKRDGKTFAAKLEVCDISTRALSMDYMVLKAANKAKRSHFCTLIDRGMIQKHFKFLVMNRLGENLYKLRLQFQQCRFSAPTALRLSLEMLDALEELHSLGYVHRDVKPSNFAMLEEKGRSSRVILLDFGLCRQFRTASGEMKQPRENTQFRGTIRYASLAAHRAQEQSPKDDLESWLYVVSEFMSGDLPWSGLHSAEREQVRRAKEQARTSEGMAQLFKFCPKLEFRRIIAYLDKLKYNSLPDYQFIRDLIILAMRNNDIRLDEPFDWEQIDEEEATTADGKWHQQNGQKGVGTSNGPLLLNGK